MMLNNPSQRKEAIAYSILLLIIGSLYELRLWLRIQTKRYRTAFLIGLGGICFLGWANAAVGIIGSENNPANSMYRAVFAVWSIGSVISRFKSPGMKRTLFTTALVQVLVPLFALFIWPAQASWGDAGVLGVFIINICFATIFLISGLLFQRK
jgi:hypothetical protein